MTTRVGAFAPATISNLGPGFDVLGLAITSPGDLVEAEWRDEPGVTILEVTGDSGLLPTDPSKNVAGVAAASVLAQLTDSTTAGGSPGCGVGIRVHKRMPLASGLGSSAASSVAGAMAVNELFVRPLSREQLLRHAMAGERAAAGSEHADNVCPSLLGGIKAIRSYRPLEFLDLPVPARLRLVVVHPHIQVETSYARAILRSHSFKIEAAVANLGNMAGFIVALHRDDIELLGRCIEDALAEPLRMPLIPGLPHVKQAAMEAGAAGCSISGSGPSVFALADSDAGARLVAEAMRDAFREAAALDSDAHVGPVNTFGARRID
ncbi:MAG: homoserine kinase [Acidobacteria bacterium]|nr:MAG: homoserine kinase [Acidobacteriota bacterium]